MALAFLCPHVDTHVSAHARSDQAKPGPSGTQDAAPDGSGDAGGFIFFYGFFSQDRRRPDELEDVGVEFFFGPEDPPWGFRDVQ